MEISSDLTHFNFGEFSSEPLPPTCMSIYLWDACKRGKLFDFKTYERGYLMRWINNFLQKTIEDIILPAHFNRASVLERLKETVEAGFSKSDLNDLFNSVDPEDLESVKKLANESKEKGRRGFDKLIKFFKQDIFPPVLWMEFNRFNQVFVDTTQFMLNRMDTWFKLHPKRRSGIRERSRLTRWMVAPYRNLVYQFSNTFFNFLKILLFIEIWSCETETELFSDKSWTLEKVDPKAFEPVFFDFHTSISGLRQAMLEHEPKPIEIDFSKPTEWAFKQLVQMVEV